MPYKRLAILLSLLLIIVLTIGCTKATPTPTKTTPPPATATTTIAAPATPSAPKELTIGCMGPMSGASAPWGWALLRALEIKIDEINSSGGLKVGKDTYTLKVVSYDHQSRADVATTVAKKLVFDDQVKYILGNAIGATQDAAQQITEPNKVLMTFVAWGKGLLGPTKPYSFRSLVSTWECAYPFYEWMHNKFPDVKTVAIISPNDTSGWDAANGGKLAAAKLGISVVGGDIYYQRGTTEFGPFVTKLLAAKPDMIDYSASPPGDGALIAKALFERGYSGVKIWLAGLDPKPFMDVAGTAANETYNVLAWDMEGTYTRAGTKTLAAKFKSKYPEPLTIPGLVNYATSEVIFNTMQKIGSIDVDKVIPAMEAAKKFDTILGPIALGGKETYGIDHQFLHPMVISVFRGGKVIDLEEIRPPEIR